MNENLHPVVLSNNKDPEVTICCPICGMDYVHHESTTLVIDGKDNYEADKSVRGDIIQIPMWCENDHSFSMKMGFHKGQTTVWFVYHGERGITYEP